jgi:hypothetical protein
MFWMAGVSLVVAWKVVVWESGRWEGTLYSSDIGTAGSRGRGSIPSGNVRLRLLRRRPSFLCSSRLGLKS